MKGFIDWNELTIDQYIEHLEDKFEFDSSGTGKSVIELIKSYRELIQQTNMKYTLEDVKLAVDNWAFTPIAERNIKSYLDVAIKENDKYVNIKDEWPEKGKDVVAITSSGEKSVVFRCNCHNPDCKEWRSSVTGGGMFIDVVKWKYE